MMQTKQMKRRYKKIVSPQSNPARPGPGVTESEPSSRSVEGERRFRSVGGRRITATDRSPGLRVEPTGPRSES